MRLDVNWKARWGKRELGVEGEQKLFYVRDRDALKS